MVMTQGNRSDGRVRWDAAEVSGHVTSHVWHLLIVPTFQRIGVVPRCHLLPSDLNGPIGSLDGGGAMDLIDAVFLASHSMKAMCQEPWQNIGSSYVCSGSVVCSGSAVVTAYDSESGRPGSNPECGIIYHEASITAQGLLEPSSLRGSTLGTRAAEYA